MLNYPCVVERRLSRPLFHHAEIVLGVLVPVLPLDGVACRCRFAPKGEIAFIVSARVRDRAILPLLPWSKGMAGRLPASV